MAFQVDCTFAGASVVTFPAGNLEVGLPVLPVSVAVHPNVPIPPVGQEHYKVYIPVSFRSQLRAAEVNGNPTFNQNPALALTTPGTWDFSVTVRDTGSAATNISYGEFGIQRFTSISVSGNPTGNAPPGGSTGWMATQSAITYASNAPYTVRVEIDNLVDLVTPIGANFVEVHNLHGNATALNSGIDIATAFAGPATPLYVWGALGTPIAASNHGTTSIGPLDSNYFGAETTNLQWRVAVPVGTAEGVYTSEIRVTVDNT
jgi:hypothetical protein